MSIREISMSPSVLLEKANLNLEKKKSEMVMYLLV